MRLVDNDEGVEALAFLVKVLGRLGESIEETFDDERLDLVVPKQAVCLLFRKVNRNFSKTSGKS